MLKSLRKLLGGGSRPDTKERPVAVAEAPVVKDDLLERAHLAVREDRFSEAAELYRKCIGLHPNSIPAHIGLGFALLRLGDYQAAANALSVATSLNPRSVDGFYMLGSAQVGMGRSDAAARSWAKALELSPEQEHIYCEFCLLLFNSGKPADAKALMKQAIAHYPLNTDFHFFLGNVLSELGEYPEAVKSYEEAVRLSPSAPHTLSNYGNALRHVGRLEESIDYIKRALVLAPDEPSILSNYLLGIQYDSRFSRESRFEAHRQFSEKFETPLINHWGNYGQHFNASRKLKIGYVSGDFRNHSLAFFIAPILKHHDRSAFEVYCYYSHPQHDAVSQNLKNTADAWIVCHDFSDAELAARIRSDEIDILIDLSGHTGHNRLLALARKPAPIQMTWLGYQATTGLKAIDFRITEESLDPTGGSEQFHSEKLLRLPSSGTYSPPHNAPIVNELPVRSGGSFTFGCLNNPAKITQQVIELWAQILQKAPGSQLLIGNATPELTEAWSLQFNALNIDPQRIVCIPKVSIDDYFALHHKIDLALDTFPYNGGTTTFHSLWMGVPIIALEGNASVSKVGNSIMHGMGLDAFCARSADEYVEKAVHFSTHWDELQVVRQSLRAMVAASSEYQATQVTASLEAALRACWVEFCHSHGHSTANPLAMPALQ